MLRGGERFVAPLIFSDRWKVVFRWTVVEGVSVMWAIGEVVARGGEETGEERGWRSVSLPLNR